MKKVYISGKISGLADFNFQKFKTTELILHGKGFDTYNPHNFDKKHNGSWTSYMKVCLRYITHMDKVAVLDDWRNSRGAIVEVLVARILDIAIYDAHDLMHDRETTITLTKMQSLHLFAKVLLNRF